MSYYSRRSSESKLNHDDDDDDHTTDNNELLDVPIETLDGTMTSTPITHRYQSPYQQYMRSTTTATTTTTTATTTMDHSTMTHPRRSRYLDRFQQHHHHHHRSITETPTSRPSSSTQYDDDPTSSLPRDHEYSNDSIAMEEDDDDEEEEEDVVDTSESTTTTPVVTIPHLDTTIQVEPSIITRYRLRRAAAMSSSSPRRDHDRSTTNANTTTNITTTDVGSTSIRLMEESTPVSTSTTSFMELIRQHNRRELLSNGHNLDDAAEEEEEEEYEEEVDVYDEDEEEGDEMDDGSTAVTIRAPTERRSSLSTPIWSTTTGMSSAATGGGGGGSGSISGGESHDMGTSNDVVDVDIARQTSVGTTTTTTASVAPMNNNTDGTDTDELLVGSGSSADGGDTTIAASSSNTTSMVIAAVPNLRSLFEKPYLREIGTEDMLSFQLSSAKPGNGVEQLYDPSLETYWQSDGICQPHWIQIQLPRRLPVTHVALYLDYQLDESYTPRTVQIDTGLTVIQDSSSASTTAVLSDAPVMELHEPVGWCIFPIYIPPDPFDTNHSDHGNMNQNGVVINETTMIPRAHWVRISVVSMHQNGRDTHVRRVALFCQRTSMSLRIPPQPSISSKLSSKLESKQNAKNTNMSLKDDDGESNTDHEEILLYARTRATVRNYDPTMLPNRSIGMEQQTIR